MNSGKISVTQYFYFTTLLVLSTFEYFFRCNNLLFIFYGVAIINFLGRIIIRKATINKLALSITFSCIILMIIIIQTITNVNANLNGLIGAIIIFFGSISIAGILKDKFVRIFVNVITFIAAYSLIIYLLCLFLPPVKDYLMNFSRNFVSLEVEKAIYSGGGLNFIIYNFQADLPPIIMDFARNCGPFWEPGMFAVYLNLALFFDLFFIKSQSKIRYLILILALISTFSTGGIIAGTVLFVLYGISHFKRLSTWLVLLPLLFIVLPATYQLEFIGDKFNTQYSDQEVGSDMSRFAAFATQLKMINNSPIIGGEKLSDYTSTKTLASGTLLPIVSYGIPAGLLYFLMLYKASLNFSKIYRRRKIIGIYLFGFILLLSFSQTILLTSIIYLYIFSGLLLHQNKSISYASR